MARPISAGKRDMILNGNLIRAILTLAIPVMINSFIQSMYNLTDTFWLGKIGTAVRELISLKDTVSEISSISDVEIDEVLSGGTTT